MFSQIVETYNIHGLILSIEQINLYDHLQQL